MKLFSKTSKDPLPSASITLVKLYFFFFFFFFLVEKKHKVALFIQKKATSDTRNLNTFGGTGSIQASKRKEYLALLTNV